MIKYFYSSVLITIACFFGSCKDHSSSTTLPSSSPVAYHTSGCIASVLGKNSANVSADSIFSYSFSQSSLNLSFSIISSCGRAENAFIVQYTIHNDTIEVAVTDTCHSLAMCNCLYMITASNIPTSQDQYKVRCNFNRSIDSLSYVAHFVEVHR